MRRHIPVRSDINRTETDKVIPRHSFLTAEFYLNPVSILCGYLRTDTQVYSFYRYKFKNRYCSVVVTQESGHMDFCGNPCESVFLSRS